MVNCSAINCTVRPGEDVSMFLFPKDAKRRRIWLLNLKRENFTPGKAAKLCERHFTPDQFTMDPATARSCGYSRLYLRGDAIPTVFQFKSLKRKNDEIATETTKLRRSNAIVKMAAHKTLNSLQIDNIELVSSATEVELSTTYQEPIESSEKSTEVFNAFTQTEHKKIQRRHAAIQANIELAPVTVKTRTIETQTDIYDTTGDLNDSFVSMCNSDDNDPDWCPSEELDISKDSNSDNTHDTNIAKERKFIVFESAIDKIFKKCRICGNDCNLRKIVRGTMLSVEVSCQCDSNFTWNSQPQTGSMPFGNLVLSAGILFSGSSPVKALNMLKHSGIQVFTLRTYNNIQSAYLVPSIGSVWNYNQVVLLESAKKSGNPLVLGGDARCCSPGHTAKYGSYSLMDLQNSKIVDIQLVQSNEVKSSYAMEMEGLKRSLTYLMEHDVSVSQLVTDRHSQVKAYMKKEQPDIQHYFDVWHVAKGIYKKLEKKSQKKSCSVINEWARSISNHMYWCAASSNGNGEEVLQKWQSILNHVINVHTGHGDQFGECQHGELEEREWIKKDSTAYFELKSVVNGRMLIKDVKKLSPGQQTSGLEAFHKVVCHFAPKLVHFFHAQMEARLYLAALHFNENASRKQALMKDGTPMFSISYPKSRKGEGVAKEVKEQLTFSYVDELMEEVLLHREVHRTYAQARRFRSLEKARPGPLTSSTPKRPKEDIISGHIRRFNKV